MALTNLLEAHCQHNSGIGDLLDPQLILCDADFQDKNDALDTMCTMLMEKGCVKPEFLLSVYKRENLGVTCLPGHIAIPHGEPAYVTKPAICVAKICHSLLKLFFCLRWTKNARDLYKISAILLKTKIT